MESKKQLSLSPDIYTKHEHLTRQMDIIPMKILHERITIIGAGATGSRICLDLAKSGFQNIEVWDMDEVDTVNLNTQFYKRNDVGKRKVEALRENVFDFTGTEIAIQDKEYKEGVFPGIVVCALDSMKGRRLLWENHVRRGFWTRLILDPRMGAESAMLYSMRPTNAKDMMDYEKTLYSDEDAEQVPCTARATAYSAGLTAGVVVATIKGFLTYEKYIRIMQWNIRDIEAEFWASGKDNDSQA